MKIKNLKSKIKENKAITLIALVITIIILLILAGVSIATLTESGLFDKVKLAKEKYQNAEELENITLSKYEELINNSNRSNNSYNITVLYENLSGATTGTITYLNNQKISKFDSIIFVYGIGDTGDGFHEIVEKEYTQKTFKFLIENQKNSNNPIALMGYGYRYFIINELTETGFTISGNSDYKLFYVYGINY